MLFPDNEEGGHSAHSPVRSRRRFRAATVEPLPSPAQVPLSAVSCSARRERADGQPKQAGVRRQHRLMGSSATAIACRFFMGSRPRECGIRGGMQLRGQPNGIAGRTPPGYHGKGRSAQPHARLPSRPDVRFTEPARLTPIRVPSCSGPPSRLSLSWPPE